MATRFAEAWSDALPDDHREALHIALAGLGDAFFEDEDGEGYRFLEFLPQKYTLLYDQAFLRRFLITLMTVGYKLALAEPPAPLLSCVAEELALDMLIKVASERLKVLASTPDFELFKDLAYQDSDYEYLYELSLDGIEDSPVGVEHGIANLHFDEWFMPFDNAQTPVHPYCE